MSVIGIYDYDFFHYENVVPNLECAKLITYYRNHNEIAMLAPVFSPARYTKFFIRKEYDDGNYPKEIFSENCEYGGRAFNPKKYKPLPEKIENTIPDMHIYEKYAACFSKKNSGQKQLLRVLNCAHMRLAPDSENLLSFESFAPYFKNKPTGIFLHDYDLASLKSYDLIKQLQDQRHYLTRYGINPYPVGNKYPIKVYNSEELQKWMQIVTIPNAFFLEYYGLMEEGTLYKICLDNKRMARQLYYNVTYGCKNEDDWFDNRIDEIFIQALFLRKAGVRILLTYDDNFFKTKELENFIKLLNCMISFQWQEGFMPNTQNLYMFCRDNARYHYTTWYYRNVDVSIEETRDIFQYVRNRNYELFKKFYEWDTIIYKGGKFINGWD